MTTIDQIEKDFIIENITLNTRQSIEVKWELMQRCAGGGNICTICNHFSNELVKAGLIFSPSALRRLYYLKKVS